ncbi:MAG: PQQ-binding-like beta-propeller repeat protein [Gemmataceae bacterium]
MSRLLALGFALALALAARAADDSKDRLWEAARKGDVAAVKAALDAGADVNARTPYGATALSFAADKGHGEVVKLLIARKADVNVKDTFYGATPLTWAVSRGHPAVVGLLLEAGATGGESILTSAARRGQMDTLKVVLEKGKPKPEALSAALAAAEKPEVKELLQKAGAKPREKPTAAATAALAPYAGTYRNADTGPVTIAMKDEELVVSADGRALYSLTRDKEDSFKPEGGGATIVFQRKGDKITGLTMKFEKPPDRVYERVEAAAASAPAAPKVAAVPPEPTGKVEKPANWPQFRGAGATGVADGQFPPTAFDVPKGINVRWKTSVPGLGHSCPVVWEDHVYVTTAVSGDAKADVKPGLYGDVDSVADKTPHTWKVFCLNKATGSVIWERTACRGVPKVKRHLKGTHANPTPATDGRHVVAFFGPEGLYCYDRDGTFLWKRDLGPLDSGWFYDPEYQWGFGSSPVIYHDRVIVQCDVGKDSFIAAYALADGRPLWQTPRDEIPSWGSPTVIEAAGRAEIVTSATKFARGYDPETGKELWRLGKHAEITTPTPFLGAGLIFVCSGYRPVQPIYAIRPGATGDISLKENETSNKSVAWSKPRGGPYMPTPIVYGDYLYVCANSGLLTCYEVTTGKQLYLERIGGSAGYTASPVAADGRLYFTGEENGVRVVKAGPKFELLAINPVGETCLATPAISDGLLLLRTVHHVVALGRGK